MAPDRIIGSRAMMDSDKPNVPFAYECASCVVVVRRKFARRKLRSPQLFHPGNELEVDEDDLSIKEQ